jgi:hydroxymethylpyrimidine/phosphomethylpyrimidine kinase
MLQLGKRVLVVAGSDSGGGAGLQADVKTITMLGGYASTAVSSVSSLTAQNTLGVAGIVAVDPEFVALQMRTVLTDIGADVIKTGMLGSAKTVEIVAATARAYAAGVPLVVDPVLYAKGGTPLFEPDARDALVRELFPLAALVTPNAPEASSLTGIPVESEADLERAAELLLLRGPAAVLVKGGHLAGDTVVDVLRTADGGSFRFESPRLASRSTHGTGCTLASAIAAGIAEGFTLESAVERARLFVFEAIRTAPGIGEGHGPLNHGHPLDVKAAREERGHETLH